MREPTQGIATTWPSRYWYNLLVNQRNALGSMDSELAVHAPRKAGYPIFEFRHFLRG